MKKSGAVLTLGLNLSLLATAGCGQAPPFKSAGEFAVPAEDVRVPGLLTLNAVTNRASPATVTIDSTVQDDKAGHFFFVRRFRGRIVSFVGNVVATSKGQAAPSPFIDVRDRGIRHRDVRRLPSTSIARCYLNSDRDSAVDYAVGARVSVLGVCEAVTPTGLTIDHCYVDQDLSPLTDDPDDRPPARRSIVVTTEMIRQFPERFQHLKLGMVDRQVFKILGLPDHGEGFMTRGSGSAENYLVGYHVGPYSLGLVWDGFNLKSAQLQGNNIDLRIPLPSTK